MMKHVFGLVVLWVLGTSCVFAQATNGVKDEAVTIKISDEEAHSIVQSINGYTESLDEYKTINLFDRKKGKIVYLRLDKIILDTPGNVVFPAENQVAVSGECTQVDPKNVEDKSKLTSEGDKYDVWFVLHRGNIVDSRVVEVIIKSVNGNPMYAWTQGEDGKMSATLVSDPVVE